MDTETDSEGFRTLVIIPAYCEEARIGDVVMRVRAVSRLPVLVIDDGSGDATSERARVAGAMVVRHPFNLGYGAALQTGYKYALRHGYDGVVQLDGDGQHDPAGIVNLLEPLQHGKTDVVIGSRYLGGGTYRAPFTRRVGMRVFAIIASMVLKQVITDPTSGYQALNRSVLEFYSNDAYPIDYPDADVLILLHRAGLRVREVPVRMYPSATGKSMHGGWKPIYYVFKMTLSIAMTLARDVQPVRKGVGS